MAQLNELGRLTIPARSPRPPLRAADLPTGWLDVELHLHLAAVIDGTAHDTFDSWSGRARSRSI